MTVVEAEVASQALFDWPLFGLQDDVRPALAKAAGEGRRAVLATLHDVVGGAPRGVGAQMAFAGDQATGFLSGGCIEADVALHARQALADGAPRRLTYGEGGPIDVRLPCGSSIDILLEPIDPDDPALLDLLAAYAKRLPALWLSDGRERRVLTEGAVPPLPPPLQRAAALAAEGERSCGSVSGPFALFRRCPPRPRLVALGSDPIAIAVAKLAAEMAFDTVLIRPLGPETCPLPGVRYHPERLETALEKVSLDRWTAVASLTHDIEQEQRLLSRALTSEACYVGALGSRRRIPERNARLIAAGLSPAEIERIRAPIGLPIGGRSPWEIAVAIIAEVVAAFEETRQGTAELQTTAALAGRLSQM